MKVFESLDAFAAFAGGEIGPGEWLKIEQERVNLFADATGDHQWIHVDPERAKSGPFGGPIAHGYLTVSLLPVLMHDLYTVEGVGMAVNYGLNKVRFPAPVKVGSSVRLRTTLVSADPLPGGGYQLTTANTVENDQSDKPVCVAEMVARYYPAA